MDCLALDSIGSVFKLTLNFTPDDKDEMLKIETYLSKFTYLYVEGDYTISQNDLDIIIHDPKYSALPHDLSEYEVEEAFRKNIY